MGNTPSISKEEVATLRAQGRKLLHRVDRKTTYYYDVTDLLSHGGGMEVIEQAVINQRDVQKDYEFHYPHQKKIWKRYFLGKLV